MNTNVEPGAKHAAFARRVVMAAIVAALFGASLPSNAQDVVVTVAKMRQSLPTTLTEFIDHPNQYINVTLQNTTMEPQEVYLKLSMATDYTSNGAPLQVNTRDYGTSRPKITLAGGETRRFTKISDFEEHFGAGRLSTNATANLMTINRIPEGDYEFCMEVYRWQPTVVSDGAPMSSSCVSFNVCYSGTAPEITAPVIVGQADNVITPRRFITIRWTSVVTNCPDLARFDYTVKIVKVPAGMTPEYAISHAPVLFSRLCKNTTVCQIDTLRNLDMRFEPGATYAVQVQARDVNATAFNEGVVISNDGKSPVVVFSWGTPDYEVNNTDNSLFNPSGTAPLQTRDRMATTVSNQDKVLASIRKPYICHPFRDATTFNAVLSTFSDELSKAPEEDRDAQIKYNGNYDDHIANPQASFDIRWMPVRGVNLTKVRYVVDLFDDIGTLSNIDSRTPLAIKTFEKDLSNGAQLPDFENPMSIADTSWQNYLMRGRKYVARVVAHVDYTYEETTTEKIVHYVGGIEADTEYDTVKTVKDETVSFTTTLLFQWGFVGMEVPSSPNPNGVKP